MMFMEVKLRWRDEWIEMLLWSSKYDRNAQMVSIFPHKPPRTGPLQPPCCLWWPWPTFLCFAAQMGPGEPSLGLCTAIQRVQECSQLLCLPESHSYLFMDLSLRTGTAPSAIAVPFQHVAAALWSTHQHEIGSYERGCAINKTFTVSEKLFSAQISALYCLFLFNNKNRCFVVFLLLQMYHWKRCQLFKVTCDFWRAERAMRS